MVSSSVELMGEVCGSDCEEVENVAQQLQKKRASARKVAFARPATPTGTPASSSSAAGVAQLAAPSADIEAGQASSQSEVVSEALGPANFRPNVNARRPAWESLDLNGPGVQHLKPPGCSLHQDTVRFMRWSGRYPGRGISPVCCTKAWGPRTGLSDREALTFVLRTLWGWYSDKTGAPCPWIWGTA